MITRPVTMMDKVKLYMYIGKLKLKKKIRNYNVINDEYDLGVWDRQYDDIDFETRSGISGRRDNDEYSIFVLDDVMFKGKRKDYAEKYERQFLDILDDYIDDQIVELGSGLGFNLFKLANNKFKKLEGYDLSQNAISLAKRYSVEKNYEVHFDVCDLNKPFIKRTIENKVVFTYTCLEQLKHYMPNVLKNMIDGKPKLVINFEVDYDSSPYIVKQYFNARDYQNNLVKELRKLEKQKKIEIVSIKKLPLSLSCVNRLSAIIWKIKE